MDAAKINEYKYLKQLSNNKEYIDDRGKVTQNAMPLLVDVFGMTLLDAKYLIIDYNNERNMIEWLIRRAK